MISHIVVEKFANRTEILAHLDPTVRAHLRNLYKTNLKYEKKMLFSFGKKIIILISTTNQVSFPTHRLFDITNQTDHLQNRVQTNISTQNKMKF